MPSNTVLRKGVRLVVSKSFKVGDAALIHMLDCGMPFAPGDPDFAILIAL